MIKTVEDLRKGLKNGVVNFTYMKKDGSIRHATGTTRLDSIPVEDHPKGTGRQADGVVNYFDLEKSEWRSFREENLVSIDGCIQESHRGNESGPVSSLI